MFSKGWRWSYDLSYWTNTVNDRIIPRIKRLLVLDIDSAKKSLRKS